jgi:hypothetical protein
MCVCVCRYAMYVCLYTYYVNTAALFYQATRINMSVFRHDRQSSASRCSDLSLVHLQFSVAVAGHVKFLVAVFKEGEGNIFLRLADTHGTDVFCT